MQRNKIGILGLILVLAVLTGAAGIAVPRGISASTKKTVKFLSVKLDGKKANNQTVVMKAGQEKTLEVTAKPAAAAKTVVFRSTDTSVVGVSKTGRITAKKAGETKITVTAGSKKYKKKTAALTVRVEKEDVTAVKASEFGTVAEGTSFYENFRMDNVLHSAKDGDIHYHVYIPPDYDGSEAYALFISLPGWEGLYFHGVGENLKWEKFAQESISYNKEMIVAAPQLDDWGDTSAEQTVALTEYLLDAYQIDKNKVYINGYSGGGETLSLVLGRKPSLYTAALHVASQWDTKDNTKLVEARTPLYFAIGEKDSYYGSESAKEAYLKLAKEYKAAGLSQEEIDRLLVLDVKDQSYFTKRGYSDQHGGAAAFAFDEDIMGWLFSQEKGNNR